MPQGGEASQDKEQSVRRYFPEWPFQKSPWRATCNQHPQVLPAGEPLLHGSPGAGRLSGVKLLSARSQPHTIKLWQVLVSLSFPAKCGLQEYTRVELSPRGSSSSREPGSGCCSQLCN